MRIKYHIVPSVNLAMVWKPFYRLGDLEREKRNYENKSHIVPTMNPEMGWKLFYRLS